MRYTLRTVREECGLFWYFIYDNNGTRVDAFRNKRQAERMVYMLNKGLI